MDPVSLEQKTAQFNEFFSIKHTLSVNLVPLAENVNVPDLDGLVQHMPQPFKMASQMSGIDAKTLRNLRNLGENAKELADYLTQQNKKIDLMMSYILQQQDEPEHRYTTVLFGAGGLVLESQSPMTLGTLAELKIFLSEEATAVFCYGEVIKCEQAEHGFHISILISQIREEDQELLVRASLHVQTQQLRARAKQQTNE